MGVEKIYACENVLRALDDKFVTIQENHRYLVSLEIKEMGGVYFATDLIITELDQEAGNLHSCPADAANG